MNFDQTLARLKLDFRLVSTLEAAATEARMGQMQ